MAVVRGHAISFGTIVVIWVNHHVVLDNIDRVDRRLLLINALLLLTGRDPFPDRIARRIPAGRP